MPEQSAETAARIEAGRASDETAYDGSTNDEVIYQRPCSECDKGLLYAPARFHGPCSGSGWLTHTVPVSDLPVPPAKATGDADA